MFLKIKQIKSITFKEKQHGQQHVVQLNLDISMPLYYNKPFGIKAKEKPMKSIIVSFSQNVEQKICYCHLCTIMVIEIF